MARQGGAAYSVLTDSSFAFDPKLLSVLRDGLMTNDLPFLGEFPYLALPWSGQDHTHQQINVARIPWLVNNARIPAE